MVTPHEFRTEERPNRAGVMPFQRIEVGRGKTDDVGVRRGFAGEVHLVERGDRTVDVVRVEDGRAPEKTVVVDLGRDQHGVRRLRRGYP